MKFTTKKKSFVLVSAILFLPLATYAEDSGSWADKISVSGDFRLRHERIDKDGSKVRNRERIRARLNITGEIDEAISAHIRLATGSDDPVSTNQTLDSGNSTKDFNLDQAYLEFAPEDCGGRITAGKMENPVTVVKDLMFDSDLSPEGAAAHYSFGLGESGSLTLSGFGIIGEERSSDSDTIMWGGQAMSDISLGEGTTLLGGLGYFLWDNTEGFDTLFDGEDSFGNSTVSDGEGGLLYATDYGIFNAFAKLQLDAGLPLAFYVDYVLNTEEDVSGPAGGEDQGWMVGTTLGKAKKEGSWQLDYNYRRLEADAVIGAFADSDSAGGGTDYEGHRIQGKYQILDQLQGAITLFVNELGLRSGATETDYNRLQVDLIAKM